MLTLRGCTPVVFVILAMALFAAPAHGGPPLVNLENQLRREMIDLPNCKAYVAGTEVASKEEDILALAEPSNKGHGWRVTMPSNSTRLPIVYVVGLHESVEIGSIQIGGL